MVEEGEIEEVSDSEPNPEQEQSRILLRKSNSAINLKNQTRKEEANYVEYLTRSHSMNDLEENCTEGRLEFLREDFNHLHLVCKHLRKTKEETQRRMKLMEIRKNQGYNYGEDIQQMNVDQSQGELCSIVPETQMGSSQQSKKGDQSQKKKKANQSAKKPVTRAAKKQLTPRKR